MAVLPKEIQITKWRKAQERLFLDLACHLMRGLEAVLLSEILILQPVLDYNILHSLKQMFS